MTFDIVINSVGPHYGVGLLFATSLANPDFQVWYREYQSPYGFFYMDWTDTGWNGWGGAEEPLSGKPGFSATGTGPTFSITIPTTELGGPGATYYYAIQVRTNLLGWYPAGANWAPTAVSSYASATVPTPTKADILKDSGVPGKGLDKAPGQQKPFNPDSKAGENAGKK